MELQKMQDKKTWTMTTAEIVVLLHTDINNGLSDQQVAAYQKLYGSNQLPEKPRAAWWTILVRQFVNFMMLLLSIAVIISLVLSKYFDACAIGMMIVLNGIVGFIQEYSAERALDALQKFTRPTARVKRNGVVVTVPAVELVPGDIVVLDAGDAVPADGRLVEAALLKTQEASLTGESSPVEKNVRPCHEQTDLAERTNMVYLGTHVVYGRGVMVVTATGLKTELGTIASMIKQQSIIDTPLQKQLSALGKNFVVISFTFVAIAFVLGIWQGQSFLSQLIGSISLAVAAIPEGLPIIVTIALALGVKAMAHHKAIVRRLAAVETLGSVSVICADKTGTLTRNEMMVRQIWVAHKLFSVSGGGYEPVGTFYDGSVACNPVDDAALTLAVRIGFLCNNADLIKQNDLWTVSGDPTEGALITVGCKAGLDKKTAEEAYQFVWEIPFDTERKMMSVLRRHDDQHVLFVKGAPDILLDHSSCIQHGDQAISMTPEIKTEVHAAVSQLAKRGLRLIAVAYKNIGSEILQGGRGRACPGPDPGERPALESIPSASNIKEQDLIFAGIFALTDPPRPEALHAIQECKKAGVRVVMITGDHKDTALAIAQELGIVHSDNEVLDGAELDRLSDKELRKKVVTVSVYARVVAYHKLRLVNALKSHGLIVAMTGDGINDAPAIKAADIGIAMGITGTDVTKNAADMIITDDNFATIVRAIRYGRGIYENIVKSVSYLVSANIAEVLVVFFAMVVHFTDKSGQLFVGLLPIQLLWINLITDGIPALALSMDNISESVMDRPPRASGEEIFSPFRAVQNTSVSICIALATVGTGWYGLQKNMLLGYSMALTTIIFLELVRAQMVRSEYRLSIFSNSWLMSAFAVSFSVHIAALYTKVGNHMFQTVALDRYDWLVVLAAVGATWAVASGLQKLLHWLKYDSRF